MGEGKGEREREYKDPTSIKPFYREHCSCSQMQMLNSILVILWL